MTQVCWQRTTCSLHANVSSSKKAGQSRSLRTFCCWQLYAPGGGTSTQPPPLLLLALALAALPLLAEPPSADSLGSPPAPWLLLLELPPPTEPPLPGVSEVMSMGSLGPPKACTCRRGMPK